MKKQKFTMLAIFSLATLSLSACKDEASLIDPAVIDKLNSGCVGVINHEIKDTKTGWKVTVICEDPEKSKAQGDAIRKSIGGKVGPSNYGDKIMGLQ